MKKNKAKREKRVRTYEEQHNRAYGNFKKFSSALIWVGILNVLSLIVALIQSVTGNGAIFFTFCFGISNLSFRLLGLVEFFHNGGEWLYYVLIFLIAILFSAGSVLCGVFSTQAKKKYLWLGLLAYTVDMFLIIPCRVHLGENDSVMWMSLGLHIIVIGFLGYGLTLYYKIIDLAIKNKRLAPKKMESEESDGDGRTSN